MRRSKRSTASVTNTAKNKPARLRRGSSLTLQILAVNMIAPLVLVLGILYMGQYQDNLIRAELETLRVQSQLFAGAIAEGAIKPVQKGTPFLFARPEEIEILVPELSRRMVRRLGETTENRTRLFDMNGRLIGDSHNLSGPGGVVQVTPLEPPAEDVSSPRLLAYALTRLLEMLPNKSTLPPYPHTAADKISFYPDAAAALQGHLSATAWRGEGGRVVMTAAAPVQKIKQVMGVVMLTRDGRQIEKAMVDVRFDVLTVFFGALGVTFFLSLYLSGMIGRPLRRLARAAELIRVGKSRHIEVPDLSHRRDEIGDLSLALRAMTQALWDRMDSIEHFAADVAHEIKNPLTSLRSAVETAARVTDQKDKDRLMEIIQHDVQRLDRLISDISNASRLDAELSRDEVGEVDLRRLLEQMADMHQRSEKRPDARILLEMPARRDVIVRGNESRLGQVFDNLISNALSFSPPGSAVIVRVVPDRKTIRISVEDEGPGIPESKLETIFERFYSERPKHESYGSHSGLGLSIARQIIDAHGGKIYAENLRNRDGNVTGACFTVILESA